jgi:hypothetical protein
MRDVPNSCWFLAFPPVAAALSYFETVSDTLSWFINGPKTVAQSGRDKDATWRSAGGLCRELDWSKGRLVHELQHGLRYRTIPPGHVIDWHHPVTAQTFNVDASEVTIIGTLIDDGAIIVAVEVLPPETDAALEQSTDEAPLPPTAPKEPRSWGLIRQIAAELWPNGYEHVETKALIKRVGDELMRQGKPVPKRDVFLRAFGRRRG